jgi:hypothetical protein
MDKTLKREGGDNHINDTHNQGNTHGGNTHGVASTT